MSSTANPDAADSASSNHREGENDFRKHCVGLCPLDAKVEPWMVEAISSGTLAEMIQRHGSPLHLIHPDLMRQNMASLVQCGRERLLDFRVFYAMKANKCSAFLKTAIDQGLGVDVASLQELERALEAGAKANDIVCTAAVKGVNLLRRCSQQQILTVIDNDDEIISLQSFTTPPPIAIRISGFHCDGQPLKSRFGFDVSEIETLLMTLDYHRLNVQGIHFHLHGASIQQRVEALRQSLVIVERFRSAGHAIRFVDMGGGIPVGYLDQESQWDDFWIQHGDAMLDRRDAITHDNHKLGRHINGNRIEGVPNVYPCFKGPVGSLWLGELLDTPFENVDSSMSSRSSIGNEFIRLNLQLRCEPGRSLLDGCGVTLARVEFRKRREDRWLIGLAMNHTQCRTTHDEHMVDPILIPSAMGTTFREASRCASNDEANDQPIDGYLVGAYCTETDLIMLRCLHFPKGVRVGDIVMIPNTAGYWMHMMESPSHQMPLAKNLIWSTGALDLTHSSAPTLANECHTPN
ncbi:Diaminopimelate decarboxylase [Rubripirellula amarantea]|uniref:Diaminopimelate decarboxylase n=1 Tax=Rubripirellula amarantea TaxID=2527999 RepID=A0A5C5WHV0_9BACT|nr:Y4yA family PLP-dependent enzyme [Rubripirellula amarantea]TWT49573.1 Diaminopimelate decarboxylase [Rubripirellula amarantea]